MRTETDSLGSMEIPADVYWGIHTARAFENFPITRRAISVLPGSRPRARAGQAGRGARQQGDRRARRGQGRRHRSGLPGDRRRRAARPVHGRRHPGRRRHLDEHEHQRGHRQSRASRSWGLPFGDYAAHAPDRRRQPQPVHQRRLPDRDQARDGVRHQAAARRAHAARRSPSPRRAASSRTSSRSGAPSCRMPCR